MSDFNIKVGAELDGESVSKIKRDIQNIEADIKLNLKLDGSINNSLNQINNQMKNAGQQVSQSFNRTFNLKNSETALNNISNRLKTIGLNDTSIQQFNKGLQETLVNIQKISVSTSNNIVGNGLSRTFDVSGIDAEGRKVTATLKETKDGIVLAKKQIVQSFSDAKVATKEFAQTSQQTSKSVIASYDALAIKQRKLSSDIDTFVKKNTKLSKEMKNQFEELKKSSLNALNTQDSKGMTNIQRQFAALKSQAKATGEVGQSFFGNFQDIASKFSSFIGVSTIIMKGINGIKEGFNTIVELDTAMIELKKVCDDTSYSFENFYYKANDIAKSLGQSTAAVIQMTVEFAQMGYNLEQSTTLAETASKYKTISPEMTQEQALDSLISTMKAYKIEANNALDGIASKVNYVGNNFSVTNNDIAEFLKRSASSIAGANTSLDENIALGEAITEVTRDAANAGQVLKTYAARLRGIDEESGLVNGQLEITKSKLYDLTGVNVYDPADDSLRSIYDITSDLADVWDDLTDKQRGDTIELIAGKRNANAINALISNFDSARQAVDGLKNSAGGADAEFEKASQGIEFKLNTLKETGTGIWQNLIDSDSIKDGIDLLTNLLSILDKISSVIGDIGGFNVGAGILGGVFSAKGQG